MLLFFPLLSCTDQGCIEADDFGEYQTQTLQVDANAAEDSCKYDSALPLTDASQGSGIKTCLTSGATTVADESNSIQRTSSGGCNGKQVNSDGAFIDSSGAVTTDSNKMISLDGSHLNICITSCVNACNAGSSSTGTSANPEPNWKATDQKDSSQNSGVQILPGSQISINVTGTVVLSNSATYNTIYIPVDALSSTGLQQNYTSATWSQDSIFDVAAGQSFNMKFSGNWQRTGVGDSTNYYYTTADIGGGSNNLSPGSTWNTAIYNGARTLIAYTIPHPSGYSFDSSQSSEVLGNKGVPLLPDPLTWTCDYDSTKAYSGSDTTSHPYAFQSTCYNKTNGYQSLGYASSVDQAVLSNTSFVISSSQASSGLGYYGGPIRWSGDGIAEAEGGPFINNYNKEFDVISSTEFSIPAGASLKSDGVTAQSPSSQNLTIGSSGITITNNDTYSYMMFMRSNLAACTLVTATVKDSSGNVIKNNVSIPFTTTGGWNSPYPVQSRITLGPGQKVIIIPYSGCAGTGLNAIKFLKYQDIPITQSGFVRFTTLNASSGSCTLNARIINPKDLDGSSRENSNSDYYEYDDFSASTSTDPLDSLLVPSSGSTSQVWSNKVFVRKGQTIRFSPISWDSKFTGASGASRQCGAGMVMQITPRPAVLCKGVAYEAISSTDSNCLPDIDLTSGDLIGCQAYASQCNDSSNTTYYCPYTDCRSTMNCTNGDSSNNYTKTCSTPTSQISSTACVTALSGLSSSNRTNFQNACTACSGLMLTNAQLPAKTYQTIDQCYDLENYTGKAQNITAATGTAIASTDDIYTKGAKKLGIFNGTYGNFEQFSKTNTVDSYNSNVIYQSKNALTFSQDSRLKFFFATNNGSFLNLDSNYSSSKTSSTSYPYSSLTARGTSYTGTNGFKISFDGTLQFSNGQWLEAKLCRETDTHSCRNATITSSTSDAYDVAINAQPHLIEINDPVSSTSTTPVLSSTANYKFDAFGALTRTTAAGTKDCSIANQGIDTQIGNVYYCHTYLNSTSSYIYDSSDTTPFSDSDYTELNKLRLTFKIKDPEVPNCIIPGSGSATNNGVKILNPAYQSSVCYTGSNCRSDGRSCSGSSPSYPCTGYSSGGSCVSPTTSMYNGYFSGNVCRANSEVVGQTCTSSDGEASLSSTNPCRKQFYCGSTYANNSGKYYVTVKVSNPPGNNISNVIGGVITPVVEVMDGKRTIASDGTVTQTVGQSQRIYTLLVQDSRYQAILTISITLMLVLYGMTYLMGITDLSSSDLINRCIKIALIYFFASPTGWQWFNLFAVKWFKDGTDYLAFTMASSFDDSPAIARALSINDYYDKSVLFSSVDKVFGMFFSQAVQKKISALLFASIFGWVYLWIIYLSFMLYVYAVGYAVLYYLTAQIFISILFTLGPIFFIFTLFGQTKDMFENWLKQLIGFSLQQIFLLTTLAFFNMMMYEVLKMSLGYRICWDEVWTINIITRISLLSFWTVASIPPSVNTQSEIGEIGHPEGIPSLFSILFIWVVASLMDDFIKFMTDLGSSIGGSLSAKGMAGGAVDALKTAQKVTTERFNDIKKSTIGEPLKRMDAALFDSGEHADAERNKRKQANLQDQKSKDALSKAGNEAMSKFKRENASTYAAMNEEEKKAALSKAKAEGMKKEADRLGISPENLERLKKDKGLKYEGSNILAAAAQAARQKAGFGGGTLDKSLNDAKINTMMKFGEASEGMKKMSAEERKDFIDRARNNEVKIDSSTSQKVIGAAQNVTKPVVGAALGSVSALGGAAIDASKAVGAKLRLNEGVDWKDTHTKANIDSARKKASQLGKDIYRTSGAAGDSFNNAANRLMNKTKNAAGLGEYNEARKQLEDSGKITKMPAGANWARTDEEKKQIRDQMLKNREAIKTELPKANVGMTIAKLATLDRGLKKDETNSGMMAAASSKIFGPGGMSNAINSQFDKQKIATEHDVQATSAVSQNIIATANNAAKATSTERSQLQATMTVAQNASNNIKKVEALEKQLEDPKKPGLMSRITGKKAPAPLSEQQKEGVKKQIADIKASDSVERGGSGYFENAEKMSNLREQHKAASDPKQKEELAEQMKEIVSQPNYIESEGGNANGLNRANAMYQESSQKMANIDAKSSKMEQISTAVAASSQTFETVMQSPAVQNTMNEYNKLSAVDKKTGGRFSKNAKAVINDHNKIEAMKKDYSNLGKLTSEDLEIRNSGKFKGTSKAAAKHEEFAKTYQNLDKEIGTTTPATNNPDSTNGNTDNNA